MHIHTYQCPRYTYSTHNSYCPQVKNTSTFPKLVQICYKENRSKVYSSPYRFLSHSFIEGLYPLSPNKIWHFEIDGSRMTAIPPCFDWYTSFSLLDLTNPFCFTPKVCSNLVSTHLTTKNRL